MKKISCILLIFIQELIKKVEGQFRRVMESRMSNFFISEFGVSIYDGGTLDKNVYLEEADLWIDWMKKKNQLAYLVFVR